MKTINENNVSCVCGFILLIREFDLDEISAGVWGTIKCLKCETRLNKKIQEVYENNR